MYHIKCSNTIKAIATYSQGVSALAFSAHSDALSCVHKAAESALRYINDNIPDVTVHIWKGEESASIWCNEVESAQWEVFEEDFMLHIESRNVDGLRVTHEFQSVGKMLDDWNSDDPTMGDNEILLVVQNGMVLYSSMGRPADRYEDTLRTADVMEWFAPSPDSEKSVVDEATFKKIMLHAESDTLAEFLGRDFLSENEGASLDCIDLIPAINKKYASLSEEELAAIWIRLQEEKKAD